MKTISKILIANRGEIAARIARTCRAMGIRSVAVFSDADEGAPHVAAADEAVRIGPAPSVESYLVVEKLIDAAHRTGAEAIHPGYGFLSENAAFARAVQSAGLVFIGPSPDAILAMGKKRESKELVEAAGVPTIPGYAADDPDIIFPVLVKASAGGGGKGMRIVRAREDLAAAMASARREAESSFGDGTLLLERYVESPRHVEIQILGDTHGNLVHIFERECSIQRRHQKVVEETPSPALDAALRARMGEAAVKIGRVIDYSSAGTVEFILAPDGAFYFLEVNTRLQVEHPVTEMVTGLDLVAEQIRIAEGRKLPFTQDDLRQRGHAIEVRLYAEDPENDFLPCTGRLLDFHVPPIDGLRVDAGVEAGSEIGIHYDPMLAKIVAHAPSREEAIRKLRFALEAMSVQGSTTNAAFLARVLDHPEFVAGQTDTHFIERNRMDLLGIETDDLAIREAAMVATLVCILARRARASLGVPSGWRNNPVHPQEARFTVAGVEVDLVYRAEGDRMRFESGAHSLEVRGARWAAPWLEYEHAGIRRRARVISEGASFYCHLGRTSLRVVERPRFPERRVEAVPGACVAPMPGKVVALDVAAGQSVRRGQLLAVLEAMKMEHAVKAPADGEVERVLVAVGEQVEAEQLLLVVKQP